MICVNHKLIGKGFGFNVRRQIILLTANSINKMHIFITYFLNIFINIFLLVSSYRYHESQHKPVGFSYFFLVCENSLCSSRTSSPLKNYTHFSVCRNNVYFATTGGTSAINSQI